MRRLAPIVVLGGSLMVPLAPAASTATTPAYTCQSVGEDGHGTVTGVQDCRTSQAAVTNGRFTGSSIVGSRQFGFSFFCTGGGEADMPRTVIAHGCTTKR